MNPKIKHTYREILREIFYKIRTHMWYQRLILSPLWLRVTIAIFLFFFGIIGLVTPIPAGFLMIIFAWVLVFGLRVVKRQSIKIFFLLRLHRVIEYMRLKIKK